MGVENCLQLSTSTCVMRSSTIIAINKNLSPKCNLSKFHGLNTSFPMLSSSSLSSTSFVSSSPRHSRKSSIVCKASEAVDQVLNVNDSSWKELVLGSQVPVLVDFWAPWCGPCKLISPVIDELAKEYAGKITVFKLNTDESPNVATQYNIRSIPTFLFFKNGERIDSVIGAVPKSTLTEKIDKYLGV
ncbi:hypothetical protein RND81_02G085900 [Saponaria officinalis]|uniref:Thioredoxin domain-containing protein n=1 Tax=Saponaria officinalis TaxID=3572 RepID=A0AAW1MR81_SAPOF